MGTEAGINGVPYWKDDRVALDNPQVRARGAANYEEKIAPYEHPNYVRQTPYGEAAAWRGSRHETARGLARLYKQRNMFGYGDAETALSNYAKAEMPLAQAGADGSGPSRVNLRHDQSPTGDLEGSYVRDRLSGRTDMMADIPGLAQLSQYARERLGSGLTPDEVAALRGPAIESVEAARTEGERTAGNRLLASGIDPRSNMGQAAFGRLERQREMGRADVERNLIQQELARKGQIEGLATTVASMQGQRRSQLEQMADALATREEGQRQYDVGADQTHLERVQRIMAALADQQENRREFDTGLIQSKRQARLSRALLLHAMHRAEPTGLEKTASIIGGITGGLGI